MVEHPVASTRAETAIGVNNLIDNLFMIPLTCIYRGYSATTVNMGAWVGIIKRRGGLASNGGLAIVDLRLAIDESEVEPLISTNGTLIRRVVRFELVNE